MAGGHAEGHARDGDGRSGMPMGMLAITTDGTGCDGRVTMDMLTVMQRWATGDVRCSSGMPMGMFVLGQL